MRACAQHELDIRNHSRASSAGRSLPAILPQQLAKVKGREFSRIMRSQSDRLAASLLSARDIEEEHRAFLAVAQRGGKLRKKQATAARRPRLKGKPESAG